MAAQYVVMKETEHFAQEVCVQKLHRLKGTAMQCTPLASFPLSIELVLLVHVMTCAGPSPAARPGAVAPPVPRQVGTHQHSIGFQANFPKTSRHHGPAFPKLYEFYALPPPPPPFWSRGYVYYWSFGSWRLAASTDRRAAVRIRSVLT